MKRIITILLIALTLTSNAQINQSAPMGDAGDFSFSNPANRNPINDFFTNQIRYTDKNIPSGNVVGSPYLNEEFIKGEVYYKGEYSETIYFRINALNDEIEVKDYKLSEEIFSLVLDKNIVLKPEDGHEISLETLATSKNGIRNGYVKKIYTSQNFEIFIREKIKYTEAIRATNSMVRSKPARFTRFSEYYLSLNQQRPLITIPLKKKYFKEFIESNSIEIDLTILKSLPRKLNRKEDIIRIFQSK